MNVADSSTISKYLLREEGWIKVRRYLEEGVITLKLASKEVLNALWKRVQRKEVDPKYAFKVAKSFIEHSFLKFEEQDNYLLITAFKIASKNKIAIYDALFIALAKKLNFPLITSDEKQAKAARQENIEVIFIP